MTNQSICKYNPSFQVLRGICAILVFITHFFGEKYDYFGSFAVEIFFVLSGFLYSEVNLSFSKVKNKIKKIYPIHIFMLIVYVFINGFEIKKVLLNIFLVQSWIPNIDYYFSYNAVSWFLSSYIFCLLSNNIINYFSNKLDLNVSKKRCLLAILIIMEIELLLLCLFKNNGLKHWILYIFPLTRVFDFAGGGFIARLSKYYSFNNKAFLFSICICITLLWISIDIKSTMFYGFIWFLPSLLIIMELSKISIKDIIFYKIGNVSLDFFMIHYFIIRIVKSAIIQLNINESNTYMTFLVFVLSVCLTYILCIIIEKLKEWCNNFFV